MLTGYIRGQELRISTPEIAADSIKYLEAEFHFAGRDWDGYVKTAYFINGASKFALVLADDRITADMGLNLTAGEWEVKLSGVKGDSRITTTTEHVYVREFGSTDGTLPDVTATQAEQILAKIGDLSNLTTEDKTSLVAAINEAAKSGGGGSGGGKDGTGIESITYKGEDESGGNMYTVLLTDGTSYDITAPKGDKGEKGDTGATGPQGPAGAPGKDGAGMDITGATVGQIAKITAVDSDGKPTAWSPVDMPTGEGETWELLSDNAIYDDVSYIATETPPCKRIRAYFEGHQVFSDGSQTSNSFTALNADFDVDGNQGLRAFYVQNNISRFDSDVVSVIDFDVSTPPFALGAITRVFPTGESAPSTYFPVAKEIAITDVSAITKITLYPQYKFVQGQGTIGRFASGGD